jgi:DNA-binding CsgD family transcriptional regulator
VAMSEPTGDSIRLLRLEQAAAGLRTGATDDPSVQEFLLAAVGSTLGWDHAAVWQPGPDGKLTCGGSWTPPGRFDLEPFEAETRRLRLATGEGLPGRVWQSGESAWIPDVIRDPNFPRAEVAAVAGLHTALCFPVVGDSGPIAVVEAMTSSVQEPDPELLATLESLGRQAGWSFEHLAAQRAVRESEASLRSTPDALSGRETEVLALMAEGLSDMAIAERLAITERSVEKHVTSIFSKLDLPTASEHNRRVLAVVAYLGD